MIDLCRNLSIPIIFTRHNLKSPSHYRMLGEIWNNDLIIDGTPEAELMLVLNLKNGDKVLEKNTYSGRKRIFIPFRGTGLEEYLVERGIKEVIITGVMTNLCCEMTAREAFVRGFRVFFLTDATATSESKRRSRIWIMGLLIWLIVRGLRRVSLRIDCDLDEN
ncbi:hypothetical protein NE237_012225 [Protea cynaroides]|uniref:Isochorismatase-like domain-containing protein n=1 Tax=Protea cynaroides TaxID=273540 RepID=A0A9Q0JXT7_9MAGN|nr:hypothetical protein NE237_012225 [Protea cynaroides]